MKTIIHKQELVSQTSLCELERRWFPLYNSEIAKEITKDARKLLLSSAYGKIGKPIK